MAALPRNDELAGTFELLADLLELDGADRFRLAAYRRAAQRIGQSSSPVARMALEGRATELDGIGDTIQAKIVELAETGELAALQKARARVPEGVVDVMRVPGLGPKRARQIWEALGVESVSDLERAAGNGELRDLPGLGARSEARIVEALEQPLRAAPRDRVLLGRALTLASMIVAELRDDPASNEVSEAGSVRRRVETVKDVDLVATADDPAGLIGRFVERPWVAAVEARGGTRATVLTQDGVQVDLRVVASESYGNLLQHFTGSKEHNVALREAAVRAGLSVSEWGVQDAEAGRTLTMATEQELYEFLGYSWVPPELREDAGELEAARAGDLPTLVGPADVKGDLHVHTDWSDGKATLEEMVTGARRSGLRYVAISDHGRRLRGEQMSRQAAEIARINERSEDIRVLSSVEVDIRADGTLELPDEVLAERDWVVASIHSGFRGSRDALTRRMIAAIKSPYVDCIGHPTGRRLNSRAPYDVDLDAIFELAAATQTCLEINGQPDRLDLRDSQARAAAQAGVPILVSSDAHSVNALEYRDNAVQQARRGWLEEASVLNTSPWRSLAALRRHRLAGGRRSGT